MRDKIESERKLFYRGLWFDSEKEFFDHVFKWQLLKTTPEDFKLSWGSLGDDIERNFVMRKIEMTNKEMENYMSDLFVLCIGTLLQHGKKEPNETR